MGTKQHPLNVSVPNLHLVTLAAPWVWEKSKEIKKVTSTVRFEWTTCVPPVGPGRKLNKLLLFDRCLMMCQPNRHLAERAKAFYLEPPKRLSICCVSKLSTNSRESQLIEMVVRFGKYDTIKTRETSEWV